MGKRSAGAEGGRGDARSHHRKSRSRGVRRSIVVPAGRNATDQPRQFVLPIAPEITVDLFAGGGGASLGVEMATGRHVDIAVNHDAEAIAMHEANHPQTRHFVSDVFEVDPRTVCGDRPVGLLWASPDCFPKGALVLTERGYRPIETIRVGDRVLSHKGQWRVVTETSSAVRPILTIRGHGHPGLRVSAEHPFYTRATRADQAPRWRKAGEVEKGMYWATPRQFPNAAVPPVPGRGMAADARLLWLAGRYVGDGWTRLTKGRAELVITCGRAEAAALRLVLGQWPRAGQRSGAGELSWTERETRTAVQFATSHRGLVEWLREHFGHRAEAKGMPAWAFGVVPHLRQALLDGYISADGHRRATFTECTTVSKALAFGIKALATSLGKTVAVYTGANSDVIEGRKVNARPYWRLRWRHEVDTAHRQTFGAGLHEWTPIRERTAESGTERVFNIGVDADESYIVDGIVVHNCKHFSKAKGAAPVSKRVRNLAWVVVRWARDVNPRVICLENVTEWQTWGPLGAYGRPCPERKGRTFARWKRSLERLGYVVEHRELRACDYGAPTIRRRLFLVARCDGQPIVWPEPTHADPKHAKKLGLQPWRTAAECIDWTMPAPSIFERDRPLADATLRRVAHGVMRYVVNAPRPFIVPITHSSHGRAQPIDEPLRTITTAHRGEFALATPVVRRNFGAWDQPADRADEPVSTITTQANKRAVVAPTLVEIGYGERKGQAPRAPGLDKPLGTAVAGGNKHALVAAFLVKHFGGEPAAGKTATDLTRPWPTILASGGPQSLVTTTLAAANLIDAGHADVSPGGVRRWGAGHRDITRPVPTVLAAGGNSALVTSRLAKLNDTSGSAATDEPLVTVISGVEHRAEVHALLLKWYGTAHGQAADEPLHTVTTRDRFGLVTVAGEAYAIADIGMRMLQPRELFRAQGFPESYIIDRGADGRLLTKTSQIRMVGNSVCPPVAAALVRANYVEPGTASQTGWRKQRAA